MEYSQNLAYSCRRGFSPISFLLWNFYIDFRRGFGKIFLDRLRISRGDSVFIEFPRGAAFWKTSPAYMALFFERRLPEMLCRGENLSGLGFFPEGGARRNSRFQPAAFFHGVTIPKFISPGVEKTAAARPKKPAKIPRNVRGKSPAAKPQARRPKIRIAWS